MSTVKASCEICGDFDLPANKVLVKLYPQKPTLNHITFICVKCNAPLERRELKAGTLQELLARGAVRQVIQIPAEVLEDHPILPAMTQDDILDFMLELKREDDLSALAR